MGLVQKNTLGKVKQRKPPWWTWLTCFSYCFVVLQNRAWHTLPLAETKYGKAYLQQMYLFIYIHIFKNSNVKKFKGFMKEYLGHFHWGICQRLGSIPTMLLDFLAAKDLSVVISGQKDQCVEKRHRQKQSSF